MRWLFDINNPVMRWITKIFDCMCLSLIWVVASLPMITIGASTTALFAAIHRYIRLEEGGLWKTFWHAFRENFKRSTLCWIVVMLVLVLLAVDVLVFRTMALNGQFLGKMYWVILLLIGIALTWMTYIFSYAERFNGTVKDVLWFSLLMMILHPIKAFVVLALLLGATALVVLAPGFLMIVPAAVCWLCDSVIASVFALHLREEDREQLDAQKKEA